MNLQTEKPTRRAPFSIRLTEAERLRLEAEADGLRLGTYIKAKALGRAPLRRASLIQDRKALAEALALLGKTHYASNINQLAHLAHLGVLPLTPDVIAELVETLRHIAQMRALLIEALGLKSEGPA